MAQLNSIPPTLTDLAKDVAMDPAAAAGAEGKSPREASTCRRALVGSEPRQGAREMPRRSFWSCLLAILDQRILASDTSVLRKKSNKKLG